MRRAGLAAVVFITACRAPGLPEAARYPAGTSVTARWITVGAHHIRLVDVGSGPAVLFIHGFGASVYAWRANLDAVAKAGYRAIALDLPGFGSSDKPDAGYDNASYVGVVVGLLDSLRLPDAVLVGHSMGGAIAADVALTAPARVRGLVLVDAAGLGTTMPWLVRMARWRWAGPLVTGLRDRALVRRLLRSAYGDPALVADSIVDQYYAPVAEAAYGRAVRGVLREFRFDDLRGRLAAVTTPTLLVWGARDRWTPLDRAREFALELPRAALVVIPDAGHAAPEEDPVRFNRALLAFLKSGLPQPPANVALRGAGR